MRCPGQDTRFWTAEDVTELECDRCGQTIELFKDDGVRRCPSCGKRVVNPKVSIGCAQWCAHAKECLGYDPKELQQEQGSQSSLADQLIEAMKLEFGDDQMRITHALTVLDLAEQILRQEKNADPRVVIASAILHDIGIQEAERKHGSSAGKYQQIEGPPIAERILRNLRFDDATVRHVCRIVAHHHSADFDTVEFRVLWDADNLLNTRDECGGEHPEEIRRRLAHILRTDGGKLLAGRLFGRGPDEAHDEKAQ